MTNPSGRATIAIVIILGTACTPPAITALNEGSDASIAGRYEEALRHYDRAITIDPVFATTHCARGEVLIKLKRFGEAAEAFGTCLDLNPGFLEGRVSLAIALLLSCDYVGAQTALDEFDRAKSTNARVLENAEWVRVRLKKAATLGGRCLPSEDEVRLPSR